MCVSIVINYLFVGLPVTHLLARYTQTTPRSSILLFRTSSFQITAVVTSHDLMTAMCCRSGVINLLETTNHKLNSASECLFISWMKMSSWNSALTFYLVICFNGWATHCRKSFDIGKKSSYRRWRNIVTEFISERVPIVMVHVSTLQHIVKTQNWWKFPSRFTRRLDTKLTEVDVEKLLSYSPCYFS